MSSSSPPPPPTGILYRVDGETLNTLIEKYDKSLATNASEQERLDKLRLEYVGLRSRLTTLPQQLEYDALVPLCRRALCPGKIIHTNEIMCLLGDNWFVECSAVKAIEIVNHRIAKLDEQHEGLKKERELINNWKQEAERQLIETIGEGTIEIREDYVEEHEKHWRERHRESVRRYHQQLAKQREEAKQEKNQSNGEIWSRLDELEIQEELEDYLEQEDISEEKATNISQALLSDNINLTLHQQPTRSTQKEKDTIKLMRQSEETVAVSENSSSQKKTDMVVPQTLPTSGKKVKFSADNIIHDISDDTNYTDGSEQEKASGNASVSFTEDSTMQSTYPCFDPIMIRFRHTSPSEIENDEDADASGTEEEDQSSRIVSSPGDIVKVFGPTSINAISNKPLPKSILKPFAPPLVTDRKPKKAQGKQNTKKKVGFSSSTNDEDDVDLSDIEPSTAMSKIVTERVPIFTSLQLNDTGNNDGVISENQEGAGASKPLSLFKMRRQQQQSLGVSVTSSE